MSECIDLMEPWIEIKFKGWKENQKELIEFVLQISNLNLSQLAEVIEENPETVNSVIKGEAYLTNRSIINLNHLIYMFSCACDLKH